MRNLTIAALAACAVGANAGGMLWSQGTLISHPGQGAGGADASAIETAVGSNLFGWGAQQTAGNSMADDFVIGAGETWDINRINFYAYQTNSGTTPSITGVMMKIWNVNPMGQTAAGAPGGVYGDMTTNEMDSVSFSNIYRVQDIALTNTARPIMRVVADINVSLGAGTYWLGFQFTGSPNFSGPWTPPVAVSASANNLDAMQATANGVYNQAWQNDPTNTVPGAAMFEIEGTVVPEPGTFIAIGLGLAGLALARRRK